MGKRQQRRGGAKKKTGYSPPPPRRGVLFWVLGGVVAALVVILVVSTGAGGIGTSSSGGQTATKLPKPPPAAQVTSKLAATPSSAYTAAGTAGAAAPAVIAGSPTTSILYVGAEYCPYCAAERWAMITALQRFGRFTNLGLTHSASDDIYPNTPTFTFYKSTYKSPYITFTPMELSTNVKGSNGQYTPLQKLTFSQNTVFTHYDAPPYVPAQDQGSIPFLLVGHRYVWVGAGYSPTVLAGKTWTQIASAIESGKGPIAQNVLENANELTAGICAVDGQKPAAVCGTSDIKTAAAALLAQKGQ